MAGDFPQLADLWLEVEQPPGPGLRNLILNPTGATGGWGWRALDASFDPGFDIEAIVSRNPSPAALRISGSAASLGGAWGAETQLFPVTPFEYLGTSFDLIGHNITSDLYSVTCAYAWYDAAGNYLGTADTAAPDIGPSSTAGTVHGTPVQVPSYPYGDAAYAALVFTGDTPASSATYIIVNKIVTAQAATAAEVTNLAYIDPAPSYTNVLGSSITASITRADINTGELAVTIKDVNLDPATVDLLRPGRRIQLTGPYDAAAGDVPEVIFHGKIDGTPTVYDYAETNPTKRATISLHAVDDVAILANTSAPDGYTTAADLASVLEKVMVLPWLIDGSDAHTIGVKPAITNPDASALDQVVIVRDTLHGYAWVNRYGQFVYWTNLPTTTALELGEADYNAAGPVVAWDTDEVINDISITHVVRNAITGETTEATWGPYQDLESVREWGVRHRDFTVSGLANNEATMRAWANAVFASNAQPEVRVTEVTYPVRNAADVATFPGGKALIDLYDLVRVTNTDAGLDQLARVTSIQHDIAPGHWDITLGFSVDGGSPAGGTPSTTPAVPAGPATVGVTTPEKPHYLGTKATAQSVDSTTPAVLSGWSNVVNAGGWTASGGVYTVPRTGRYLVTASIGYAGNATGRRYAAISKNGAETYNASAFPNSTAVCRLNLSGVDTYNAGDTIAINVSQTSGTALNIGAGSTLGISYLD